MDYRQLVSCCKRNDLIAASDEKCIGAYHQTISLQSDHSCGCVFEVAFGARRYDVEL
jgi:hypothetical protein